jgi:hypothetical protein
MDNNLLLQLEIYLLEFIELRCVKGNNKICMVSEFKSRFQKYIGIVYSRMDISNIMINKLGYSYIVKNESRYFKGLSL